MTMTATLFANGSNSFGRLIKGLGPAMCALVILGIANGAHAQPSKDFNACAILTAEEASSLLGTTVAAEPLKGKPPRVVPNCLYGSNADGNSLSISVQFRFFKSPAEAVAALKEARLEARGRPLIINGQDAYWHPKLAHLVVSKGSTLLTIVAGPSKENERVPELARKVAELLLPKLG